MARVAEEATAFGKRTAPFLLSYDCCWTDRNQSEEIISWTRSQIAAAEPHPWKFLPKLPRRGEDNEDLVRKALRHQLRSTCEDQTHL